MPARLNEQKKEMPAAVASTSEKLADQAWDDIPTQARRSWWHTIFQIYMFLPLAILALEILFNLAGIGQGEIVMPDTRLGCKHIPDKLVTWRLEGYSRGRLNSVGMRDVEHTVARPASTTRLAFLGDSYTEGLQVPLDDIFARRLTRLLNRTGGQRYETLNFGCSSYSTGQELLLYRDQVAAYKPDIVVLLYTPGDTLENSIAPDKRATAEARPYFYLDKGGKLHQDDSILALNYQKLKPRPTRDFLRAHSTIYGAYCQTNLSLSMSDKVYFRFCRLISQIGSKLGIFRGSAEHSTDNNSAAAVEALSDSPANSADKLAVSEGIISELNREVSSNGGRLVVMAFPDVGKGDPLYIDARNHLAALAKKDGFGYLDLSEPFSQDKNPNNLFVKVHFSQLGHDLTARQLNDYLHQAGMLKQ